MAWVGIIGAATLTGMILLALYARSLMARASGLMVEFGLLRAQATAAVALLAQWGDTLRGARGVAPARNVD